MNNDLDYSTGMPLVKPGNPMREKIEELKGKLSLSEAQLELSQGSLDGVLEKLSEKDKQLEEVESVLEVSIKEVECLHNCKEADEYTIENMQKEIEKRTKQLDLAIREYADLLMDSEIIYADLLTTGRVRQTTKEYYAEENKMLAKLKDNQGV